MKHKVIKTVIVSFLFFPFSLFIFSKNEHIEQYNPEISTITEVQKCPPLNTDRKTKERARIVGLGDSLTVGIGDETKEGGYLGKLEKKLAKKDCPVTIENHSVKGFKTTDLLQHLKDDAVTEAITKAHIIMFTIGANDLVTIAKEERMKFTEETIEKAVKEYAKNIVKILARIRTLNKDAPIYVIGFYNPIATTFVNKEQVDLLITKWNNVSKNNVDSRYNSYYVRVDDLFHEEIHRYLAKDHFHLNNLGYNKIAERLMDIIDARSD